MDPDQIHHGHRWCPRRDIYMCVCVSVYVSPTTLTQAGLSREGTASSSPWPGRHPSRVEHQHQSPLLEILGTSASRPSEMIFSLEGDGSIALSRRRLSPRRSHRALVWGLNPGNPIFLRHVTLPFLCRVFLQGSTPPRNLRGVTGRRGLRCHHDILWRRRG